MNILKYLRERCPTCLRKNEEREKALGEKERYIVSMVKVNKELESFLERKTKEVMTLVQIAGELEDIEKSRKSNAEKESLLQSREKILEEHRKFLVDMELSIAIREKALDKEKERIVEPEGAEIKRRIMLPALQGKWEAEAKKIDADRVKILTEVPSVLWSLSARKKEIEAYISSVKQKPKSSGNHDLLLDATGRLSELERVIDIIDKEKK